MAAGSPKGAENRTQPHFHQPETEASAITSSHIMALMAMTTVSQVRREERKKCKRTKDGGHSASEPQDMAQVNGSHKILVCHAKFFAASRSKMPTHAKDKVPPNRLRPQKIK